MLWLSQFAHFWPAKPFTLCSMLDASSSRPGRSNLMTL